MEHRRRGSDEDGFTLVELVVALTLISIGFLALAGATSSAARMLLQSKQRQAASEQANAAIEHIRNVPYDQVALSSAPAHSTDTANPDYYVSANGVTYDHKRNGTGVEPLDVDTSSGQVLHVENVTVGSTVMTLYQYVTWVDDPGITGAEDYKRVVVLVTFSSTDNPGRTHTVEASTLLTSGSVTVGGTASSASQGSSPSPTATPTPTPSPSATGPCTGDTTGPTGTFTILSGNGSQTGFTASTAVSISLAPVDSCAPISVGFSNDNVTFGSTVTYDAANPTTTWTVASGDGTKSVWTKFTDGVANASTVGPQSITLDQTKPTVPGTLGRTVSCSGSNRTVTLSWGVSTDANFVGYRIYKNTNNTGYVALKTTASLTTQDTDSKTLNSLNYKIVGYDKAGNEGTATNVISLAKNSCS
jgi:prepilin-type N-terminal cleavage/methylation domain-containing protein